MPRIWGTDNDDLIIGADGQYTIYGLAGNDTLLGAGGDDELNGDAGDDFLDGGEGDDRLTGHDGNDTLLAGGGNDWLWSGDGDDSLSGGDGDDMLIAFGGRDTLDGGAGNDELWGMEDADVFIADGSADVIADFDAFTGIDGDGHENNDFVDLSAFYNETTLAAWNAAHENEPDLKFHTPLDWLRYEQSAGVLISAGGLRIFSNYDDGTLVSADQLNEENTAVVCFAAGTLILTDRGEVAVDEIAVGDLVCTRDNGLQPVRWIGSRKLGAAELTAAPKLRPIRIRAGALGNNIPERDLVVSPQHRVLIRSKIAQKMFGANEVLAAAKQLVLLDGIDVDEDIQEVKYFHMLFTQHEIVWSNGAETESLYTGPEALKAVGEAAVEELFSLLPELADPDFVPYPARQLLSGRKARKLGQRHLQNNRPLVAAE